MTRRLGKDAAFSLGMYGNGGMNTSYDAPTFGLAPAGVNLSQMFIAPTYAVRLGERHALGVTGLLVYQRFEAKGLACLRRLLDPARRALGRDHSNSFGAGVRVGVPRAVGRPAVVRRRVPDARLDEPVQQVRGPLRRRWRLRHSVELDRRRGGDAVDRLDIAVDVQQVRYSEVEAIGHELLPNLRQALLGADDGAGFGWNDMTTVKIGTQLRAGRGLTWRGGYSYGSQPVPRSEVLFNILAPGVMEQHATFGVSKALTPTRSVDLAVMHAFSKSVTGPNPLEVPGLQDITLRMQQWELKLSYSVRF